MANQDTISPRSSQNLPDSLRVARCGRADAPATASCPFRIEVESKGTRLMSRTRRLGVTTGAAVLAVSLVSISACTKSTDDGASTTGSDAGQQVQATAGGDGCTYEKYNGGVPKLDLKTATIGFAQSEKEANPFRITETESIKDEAAKRGIKLITTNAQSDLNKEIADIQSMIAQGAQALIISPLNSEGLDPALTAAQDAKVPIMTIDRLLTETRHFMVGAFAVLSAPKAAKCA